MRIPLKKVLPFLKEVVSGWADSKAPRMGAALAYYTIFAIAPLLLIALTVAGMWFGPEAARKELFAQMSGLVGRDGADAIQTLVAAANKPKTSAWATVAAVVTLMAGATAAFVELQDALNTIWEVKPKPGSGVRDFIRNRLLSFAMILGVGFLLLVSLVLNAALSVAGSYALGMLPDQKLLMSAINFGVSLGVITLLFAMILKFLPDVKIAWRDVWVGAFVTAVLFNLGKFLIGLYLGRSSTVSVYGAAGSFIVLLMWVYYSAQILFFGAEFTRVYSGHGRKVNADRNPSRRPAKTG